MAQAQLGRAEHGHLACAAVIVKFKNKQSVQVNIFFTYFLYLIMHMLLIYLPRSEISISEIFDNTTKTTQVKGTLFVLFTTIDCLKY